MEITLRGEGASPIIHDKDSGQAVTVRLVSALDAAPPLLELADAKGKPLGRHWFEYGEVLLASRDHRLAALRRNPRWWDGALEGCEAVERRLAEIPSPELRVQHLALLVASSADSHYSVLEREWRRERRLDLDQLFPPPLAAVLTYIRCPEDENLSAPLAERCWASLAQSIPAKRGLVEALRRIFLVPCPLPAGVYARIADLDPEEAGTLLNGLTVALTDPISRLQLIDLSLFLAETLPEALGVARRQIEHLATLRFESEVALILALTDLAYRAFGSEVESAGTPPLHRLLAAWVHASRVGGALIGGGADPAPLAERLHLWTPFPHRDLYAGAGEPMSDLAWPWHVHTAYLRFVGLGRVLDRYPELSARLNLSAIRGRLAWLPSGVPDQVTDILLLADPGLLTDGLGCLWGGDRSTHLGALLDPELASQFAPRVFSDRVAASLAELEADPARTDQWRLLWITVGRGRLPPEPANQLAAILATLDIDALIASDPLLLTPLMDLAVAYGDMDAVRARILRWADDLDSGVQPGPGFIEQFGNQAPQAFMERLTHWLHGLATRNPADPDGDFARGLEAAIHRSRALAAYLREPLTNIARHLPYARHRALRRTLLAARARPLLQQSPDGTMANNIVQKTGSSAKRNGKRKRRAR